MDPRYKEIAELISSDIRNDESYIALRPTLVHYTSVETAFNILSNKEIWMSNPLNMNDHEEVSFVMINAENIVLNDDNIKESFSKIHQYEEFKYMVRKYFEKYKSESVIDNYIFCMCEYNKNEPDGTLSMWRSYASDGGGAAIVIDTSKVLVPDHTPLFLEKVKYMTNNDRISWIYGKISSVAEWIKKQEMDSELINHIAHLLFTRFKYFSIYSKNIGFIEENEWRLYYDVDHDTYGLLHEYFSYIIGKQGILPKLKLSLKEPKEWFSKGTDFHDLISHVILGPSRNSTLEINTMKRFLSKINNRIANNSISSAIPYRKNISI
jgi:hypothetical protein